MPFNTCDMIIVTGSNKGKRCCDINKYCRHQKTKCDLCGEEFNHKSSYQRHIKTVHGHGCTQRRKVTVTRKEPVPGHQAQGHQAQGHQDQGQSGTRTLEEVTRQLQQLRAEFDQVNARVHKVEQEPKNITVVIGDENIFMGLVKRLGGEKLATKFLLENMDHKDSINIVDKLYLEGVEKNQYPIACADNYRFRYLSHSGNIVDDDGGTKIVSTLENEIHSALIEANTRLIHECIDNDDNVTLYNVYNLGTLQEQLGNYRRLDTQKFRDDLAKKVYNTSHPFFQ